MDYLCYNFQKFECILYFWQYEQVAVPKAAQGETEKSNPPIWLNQWNVIRHTATVL